MFVLIAVLAFMGPAAARASENILICARSLETGQMYHAMASNASGLELDRAAHSSVYDPTQNYVVVLWPDGQFSIIRMQPPFSVPSYVPETGIDENGRSWEVSLYSSQTCP